LMSLSEISLFSVDFNLKSKALLLKSQIGVCNGGMIDII